MTTCFRLHSQGRCILSIVLLALNGCTTLPPDLGRSDVDALVSERGMPVDAGTSQDGDSLVESLTSQPLDAESAIRIALVNNPELNASYAQLGFAAADVYAAGRIRNPVFSASVLPSSLAVRSRKSLPRSRRWRPSGRERLLSFRNRWRSVSSLKPAFALMPK